MHSREPVPFNPEVIPAARNYLHLKVEGHLPFSDLLKDVLALSNMELYGSEEPKFLKQLVAYAMVIDVNGEQFVLFREFKNNKVLSFGKGLTAVFTKTSGTFQKVEDSLFRFDEQVDCLYYRETLSMVNVNAFIRMFDFYAHIQEKAEQALGVIAAQLPIANFTEFAESCRKDRRMQQKLSSIITQDYFAALNVGKVQEVVERHQLDLPMKQTEAGEWQMEFSPEPNKRWLILKVLDDDYLESPMTALQYEANSKVRLRAKRTTS
jgi:hypothetical protein